MILFATLKIFLAPAVLTPRRPRRDSYYYIIYIYNFFKKYIIIIDFFSFGFLVNSKVHILPFILKNSPQFSIKFIFILFGFRFSL